MIDAATIREEITLDPDLGNTYWQGPNAGTTLKQVGDFTQESRREYGNAFSFAGGSGSDRRRWTSPRASTGCARSAGTRRQSQWTRQRAGFRRGHGGRSDQSRKYPPRAPPSHDRLPLRRR